jgi:hypothetical protein
VVSSQWETAIVDGNLGKNAGTQNRSVTASS